MKDGVFWIIGFLLLLGLTLAVGAQKEPHRVPASASSAPAAPEAPPAETESRPAVRGENALPSDGEAVVRQVIDGDTVVLADGQVVRYIGIDAPEVSKGAECFSNESTKRNRELVNGKRVRLETDTTDRDKYGRLLRYVYAEDVFINELLVKEGSAKVHMYPPDVRYRDVLRQAEAEARNAHRGLWGSACAGKTTSDSRDCSDFATRAEAQAFFTSQGGPADDPHHLDQDRDGIVCESLP